MAINVTDMDSEVTTFVSVVRQGRPERSLGLSLETQVQVALYWIFFILDIIGNSLVLAFGSSKWAKSHAVSKLLICSLAGTDILLALGVTWAQAYENMVGDWRFGDGYCRLYNFLRSMASHTSIMTLALISVERFVCIVLPHNITMTIKHALIGLGYVWLHTVATNIPWFVYSQVVRAGPRLRCTTSLTNPAYSLATRITNFFIPLVIMWTTYLAIIAKMWLSHNKMVGHMGQQTIMSRMNRRVSLMCLAVALCFTILWTPFQGVLLYMNFGHYSTGHYLLGPMFVLGVANSCANPIIYGVMWRPFRDSVKHFFCKSTQVGVATSQVTSQIT